MLDREVGDAAPGVEPIGLRERGRRANVEAGAAAAAAVDLGLIRREVKRGEDGAKEQPRAELARDEIGVLALPAEPGAGGQRLLHDGGGVNEHLHLAAGMGDEPARQRLEPRLDDLVVVVALGIDRDRAAVALREYGERIGVRPIIEAEHDDRSHLRPERARVGAALRTRCHPGHVAVRALGKEALEPRLRFRDGIGPDNADGIEAMLACCGGERRLEGGRIAQKSRSA